MDRLCGPSMAFYMLRRTPNAYRAYKCYSSSCMLALAKAVVAMRAACDSRAPAPLLDRTMNAVFGRCGLPRSLLAADSGGDAPNAPAVPTCVREQLQPAEQRAQSVYTDDKCCCRVFQRQYNTPVARFVSRETPESLDKSNAYQAHPVCQPRDCAKALQRTDERRGTHPGHEVGRQALQRRQSLPQRGEAGGALLASRRDVLALTHQLIEVLLPVQVPDEVLLQPPRHRVHQEMHDRLRPQHITVRSAAQKVLVPIDICKLCMSTVPAESSWQMTAAVQQKLSLNETRTQRCQ